MRGRPIGQDGVRGVQTSLDFRIGICRAFHQLFPPTDKSLCFGTSEGYPGRRLSISNPVTVKLAQKPSAACSLM